MTTGAIIGLTISIGIVALIIGIIIGFIICQKYLKKQQDENPPITRDQVKAMYRQMGRTPSESQINSIMESMKSKKIKNG